MHKYEELYEHAVAYSCVTSNLKVTELKQPFCSVLLSWMELSWVVVLALLVSPAKAGCVQMVAQLETGHILVVSESFPFPVGLTSGLTALTGSLVFTRVKKQEQPDFLKA